MEKNIQTPSSSIILPLPNESDSFEFQLLMRERSARLLHKLGFVIEGHAKKYLLINGQWEDYILTSLTNENWIA